MGVYNCYIDSNRVMGRPAQVATLGKLEHSLLQQAQGLFAAHDRDGNGVLDEQEFAGVLR